jgi:hypothetical protein
LATTISAAISSSLAELLLELQLDLIEKPRCAFRARATDLAPQLLDLQLLIGDQGLVIGGLGSCHREFRLGVDCSGWQPGIVPRFRVSNFAQTPPKSDATFFKPSPPYRSWCSLRKASGAHAQVGVRPVKVDNGQRSK